MHVLLISLKGTCSKCGFSKIARFEDPYEESARLLLETEHSRHDCLCEGHLEFEEYST